MTKQEFARYFDHTLLKAQATTADFESLCAASKSYGFKMVAINPAAVPLCRQLLAGSGVRVGATIGFPLGQNTLETKLFEARNALENGCDEIDYVVNITRLKDGDTEYIRREMAGIVGVCREFEATSKVIFETCYLTRGEKEALCAVARAVRPDFVKTSTGFGTGGATEEDVILMKRLVGDGIQVKASGGVRTLDMALRMIELGVTRIGSSASAEIVDAYTG